MDVRTSQAAHRLVGITSAAGPLTVAHLRALAADLADAPPALPVQAQMRGWGTLTGLSVRVPVPAPDPVKPPLTPDLQPFRPSTVSRGGPPPS